ncbi:MAG: 16S rRNA (cytosine(967)-C(5))-methyltransferase RsmB [Candidatus Hatepunaea meridiana]|nr:16S rRNA (cytosine(967)-C(5))-methyltransferase RsmB [Candidatus Hatepunaea meridiana]
MISTNKQQRPKKQTTPREAVWQIYARWLKRKFRVDDEAAKTQKMQDWQPKDRALFQELLYGVIRRHGTLEYIIRKLSSRELNVNEDIYAIIAVALYQMLFLDRIPDHAAVDTAVDMSKRYGAPPVVKWVNAVLRRVGRERFEILRSISEIPDPIHRLSIQYSYPKWMILRWRRRLTIDKLEEFLKWNNRKPDIYLRINPQRIDPHKVIEDLKAKRIYVEQHPLDTAFIRLGHIGNPADLKVIRDGVATVQDISQSLVGRLVDPQPGEVILDLCAAPGGKTGHLSELCPDCKIIATDRSEERLALLRSARTKCNWLNVEVFRYNDLLTSKRKFDVILVDAPCTGTGVLARRPDLRWRREPKDVERMVNTQLEILRYASGMLKPGGRIIYSTCSIEREENENIVQAFLSGRKRFNVISAKGFLNSELVDENGYLSVLGPDIQGDGVFAARLEKISQV